MNALDATRKWVRSSPVIDSDNKFNVNYLGATATTYTLDTAGESHRQDVCGNDIMTCNLVFAARLPYGSTLTQNVSANDLFQDLRNWIMQQERQHSYPTQVEGYAATRVTTANAGIVLEAGASTARYQLQIQIVFEEL